MNFEIASLTSYAPSFVSNIASSFHESPIPVALIAITSVSLILFQKPVWRWCVTSLCIQAIEADRGSFAKFLIRIGVDVNGKDPSGNPLIHQAINASRWDVVLALVKAGADVDLKSKWGEIPLNLAMGAFRWDVALALIEAGADVNATDRQGNCPIFQISLFPNVGVMKALVEAGADVNVLDTQGDRPIDLVARADWWDAIDPLLETGAILSPTLLHYAGRADKPEIGIRLISLGAAQSPTGNRQIDQRIDTWKRQVALGRWFGLISNLASSPPRLFGQEHSLEPLNQWEKPEELAQF